MFDGQHNTVNRGLRTRVTLRTSVEDDLDFVEPGQYPSQAGQVNVSSSEGHGDRPFSKLLSGYE